MSSVGRNANRFNGIRSAIQNATTASTATQEQLKAVLTSTTDQQRNVTKRLEDTEALVQGLRSELQAMKMEIQSQKADFQTNKLEVITHKADIQTLKADVATLKASA
jgi:chromosome segregation ATPase